mmetsp:Transcript_20411/g.41606  ORF Transcript_20411/g.41606 Transcript_20411/m.41606 type:complete len:671 (+) Transcript_20411:41-2053(+)
MTKSTYPIHRSRGLISPNKMTVGEQSFAADSDISVDFSVYSDGISSFEESATSPSNNMSNTSNHSVAPSSLDPTSPGGPVYTDPYASIIDTESGGSPSLHLGSDDGIAGSPIAAVGSATSTPTTTQAGNRSGAGIAETEVKDRDQGNDTGATICGYTIPDWLSDAPFLIKLIMLISAAFLVGATVLLIIIAIVDSIKGRSAPAPEFGQPVDTDKGGLGYIPSASYRETVEPSVAPSVEPSVEPSVHPTMGPNPYSNTGIPLSQDPTSTSTSPTTIPTTQSPTDAPIHPDGCNDSQLSFTYILKSGIVQSAASCDDLANDFRYFVLESICILSVVDVPATEPTLVSDRCPKICQACNATKAPSVAPSSTPSLAPSLVEDQVKTLPPSLPPIENPAQQQTKSTFFVTGGHFKRSDEIGGLLGRLPIDKGAFILHLGDMNRPQWRDCDRKSWEINTEIWSPSSIPLLAIPGEDDWNECRNPDEAWELWQEYAVDLTTSQVDLDMSRQYGTENFAFVQSRVLFIGLHLVSGTDIPNRRDWRNRLDDNTVWLNDNVATHRDEVEVIVVFGHSPTEDEANQEFFSAFAEGVKTWDVPVLYFHQDDDDSVYPWTWQRNLFGVSNLLNVGVREKLWPPLRVVIDTQVNTFNLDGESWHVGSLDDNDGSLEFMEAGGGN